jgi:hypothetical protein
MIPLKGPMTPPFFCDKSVNSAPPNRAENVRSSDDLGMKLGGFYFILKKIPSLDCLSLISRQPTCGFGRDWPFNGLSPPAPWEIAVRHPRLPNLSSALITKAIELLFARRHITISQMPCQPECAASSPAKADAFSPEKDHFGYIYAAPVPDVTVRTPITAHSIPSPACITNLGNRLCAVCDRRSFLSRPSARSLPTSPKCGLTS